MRARTISLLAAATSLLALAPARAADVDDLVAALDIPDGAVVSAVTTGLDDQSRVLGTLGPIAAIDGDMALFTTGYASQVTSGEDHDLGTTGHDPIEPGSPVHDQALLTLELTVPEGMHSIEFDWYFMSREYPYYVGSDYNDRFTVIQEGQLYEGNIVFDNEENVVDVNNAMFTVTDALSLDGTGFWRVSGVSQSGYDGGGTGWITTRSPVEPGETISLRFDVHDVADGIYDSGVLVDNFRWSEEEIEDPNSGSPVELHYLSPKSATSTGGDEVLVIGRRFTADVQVWIGAVEVPQDDIDLLGDGLLRVVVPPAPDGPALVDVRASTGEHEALLGNGFTWVSRSEGGAPPELVAVDPDHADATGGAEVTITGVGLGEHVTILFGDVEATDVTIVSSTEAVVVVPELEPGAIAVRAADAAGRAGSPAHFVARGELEDPADRSSNVGGCSQAGRSPVAPLALLLMALPLALRRRSRLLPAAVAGILLIALTGCSDYSLRPEQHPHPVAQAAIVVDEAEVTTRTVAVGEEVILSGAASRGFDGARVDWRWAAVEAPEGADVVFEGRADRDEQVSFRPELPGDYLVQLVVRDHRGRDSHPAAVLVRATDGGALRVRLDWQESGHDLDLHLMRSDGRWFDDGDCFYGRPQPAWGDPDDGADDPRLLADADGTAGQLLREEIQLNSPAEGTYTVLVHHLNDRGSLTEAETTLTLWHDGVEQTLPLDPERLVQGEVWQALAITLPTGQVAAIDQVTTHAELDGPELNRREES